VGGETHMANFFLAHGSQDGNRGLVSGSREPLFITRDVIEVAGLEAHAHDGDELGGVAATWHACPEPITHREIAEGDTGALQIVAIQLLVADLWVRAIGDGPLAGAGVVIANAPYGVAEHLGAALPWLCNLMQQDDGARWRLETPAAG